MFLLLYRQLISSFGQCKYQKDRMNEFASILKREIRAIGPRNLGSCFFECADSSRSNESSTIDKLKSTLDDIVLQIARRASSIQRGEKLPETGVVPSLAGDDMPSKFTVSVARKWVDANMKLDSSLRKLLHERLKKVVFEKVLADVYPARSDSAFEKMMGKENEGWGELLAPSRDCLGTALPKSAIPFSGNKAPAKETGMGNGLEMLSEEVQSLVDKISLLVVVHFNAYFPIYEKEEFMRSVL
jgi:hypothetical protein